MKSDYQFQNFPRRFHPETWPVWALKLLVLSRLWARIVCRASTILLSRPGVFLLQLHKAIVFGTIAGYRVRGWSPYQNISDKVETD